MNETNPNSIKSDQSVQDKASKSVNPPQAQQQGQGTVSNQQQGQTVQNKPTEPSTSPSKPEDTSKANPGQKV